MKHGQFVTSLLVLAPITATMVLGCTRTHRDERAPTVTAAVRYDEAMALRDYPRTSAYYASGDVMAGPTNFEYEYQPPVERDTRRRPLATLVDPLVFLGNTVMLPYRIVNDPPTENRRYEGTIIAPTYTAAVPLEEVTTAKRPQPITAPPTAQPNPATTPVATNPATRDVGVTESDFPVIPPPIRFQDLPPENRLPTLPPPERLEIAPPATGPSQGAAAPATRPLTTGVGTSPAPSPAPATRPAVPDDFQK